MNNPIFLVSTGRTGTKYFANFFSTYCVGVSSYHTTRYTRLLNVFGNMYRGKLLSRSMVKAVWKRFKFSEIQSHDLRYIECNPYYYNMTDVITQFFPGAKFIFIIRSPKSFILSHIKWERQRWKSLIANRLVPFWQPTSYLDQIQGVRNNFYQRVEFYSKVWARKNAAILKTIEGQDNVITLTFEEVFDPETGVDVLDRLIKWLGVEPLTPITKEIVVSKQNTTNEDHTDSWDQHCTAILNKHCGTLLKEFGYE